MKFGDKDIEVSSDLPRIVGNTKPNTKVPVQVWRNGTTKNITMLIECLRRGRAQRKHGKNTDTSNRLGLALSELADGQKNQLGVEGGLLVEEVQHAGVAARAGIRQR